MKISGFQKLTLLDFTGLMACIVFTGGCNFRCPFCHNASLVLPQDIAESGIDEADFFGFLQKRRGVIEGVVVTGGEPTLQPDLADFLRKIKALGFKVKLDTNGTKPNTLKELIDEGLVDYIAMDIKTAPQKYPLVCGVDFPIERIEESKNLLLAGAVPFEFRTTLVRGLHTRTDILDAAKWIKGAPRYFLQAFKDSGGLINPAGLSAFTETEMKEFAELVLPYCTKVELRGV